ncbi:MAG: hypothetical protein CSA45_03405 [Gammaproteobacteria bacterium]|nr:MAG: hypothetical protein CSA45_03405 [Gammaproteobacteria bacterium]
MRNLLIALLLMSTTMLSYGERYKVMVKGQRAGKAELVFEESNGVYQTSLTLYPNLLAKAFGVKEMREYAEGKIKGGHYYPNHYSRKTLKGKTLLSVAFQGHQVTANRKGKRRQFAINPMGQDPLTQLAQIKRDLAHQAVVSKTYHLVTEKSQRHYSATVKTLDDGYQIHVRQKNGNRAIQLSFNKQGVLLRMTKMKKGKKVFDMVIDN